ncbi:hypothetical protein [Halodesulfovibrio sp. MK-HDV]|uniref:hypothetical protein n=1 Tax=Halodesulfovibrio sp. MK-HDV TaxID=2599925 RepID=UPI0013F6EA6C|nr:hypothetical protein [Halodesulfovibrio sp. MK-HDV]KAF1074831.1 hypothetical protein MKHDV_02383 [Halodesulfovibrio sp. MK-HDV]
MPLFKVTATVLFPAEMIPQIALMLAGGLGLMDIITPYATGPSPILRVRLHKSGSLVVLRCHLWRSLFSLYANSDSFIV